jgi:hypothetical protein
MIPKYTGYLPRKEYISFVSVAHFLFFCLERKYRIGQTYGDTSRGLPVCAHVSGNYGDFVRSQTTMGLNSNSVYI